jgi:hypothetical protein
MTATRNTVCVTLPLPSNVLGKNQGHGHWSGVARARQDYGMIGKTRIRMALPRNHEPWTGPVAVTIRWYGRGGPIPDADNVIARCHPYTDSAQHAGLYANDSQVSGFVVERDYDRDNPRVEIVFSCEEG